MKRYLPLFAVPALLALIALGHDAYIYYMDESFDKTLKFTSIGWVWANYHTESFQEFVKTSEPEVLEAIDPFLTIQLTIALSVMIIVLPILIAAEYYLLRLLFGWIGGNQISHRRKKPTLRPE